MGEGQLVAAQTRFAFKLFDALAERERSANVVISPISVWLALSLLYAGADGTTRRSIGQVLAVGTLDIAELSRAARAFMPSAPHTDTALVIANAIWADQRVGLADEFARSMSEDFGTTITTLDFNSPAAPDAINQWVAARTRDKITYIMQDLNRNELIVIVNAVYFKGAWACAFDATDTHSYSFTLSDGRQTTVQMMRQHSLLPCFRGAGFQAVQLPYAPIGDQRLCMEIFLPDEASSLVEFRRQLSAESWSDWHRRFELMECELALPQLSLSYDCDLAPALAAIGMGIAFDPGQAGFHRIGVGRFALGQIKHVTQIDVNEVGTEAAAATMPMVLGDFDEPMQIIVDRPFICAITEAETKALLFIGAIAEP